jgi:hypothetical protein
MSWRRQIVDGLWQPHGRRQRTFGSALMPMPDQTKRRDLRATRRAAGLGITIEPGRAEDMALRSVPCGRLHLSSARLRRSGPGDEIRLEHFMNLLNPEGFH